MNDCISSEIEKASEKIVAFDANQVQGWLFSPQFLAILQITKIASMICMMVKKRSLPDIPKPSYEGRQELYSDVSIFITALVMKVWKLSLGEITKRLKLYPQLAIACGYQVGKVNRICLED